METELALISGMCFVFGVIIIELFIWKLISKEKV